MQSKKREKISKKPTLNKGEKSLKIPPSLRQCGKNFRV